MKILGVCGDSYMSAISFNPNDLDNGYGKHFTELLASKLGWKVVTYARGACSNQTIRLQIDEIIKHKPDLVIIGLTSVDRFEYPISCLTTKHYLNKWDEKSKKNMYEQNNGIYNIDYFGFPDKSSEHEGFNKIKPKMISETLTNFFLNNQSKKNSLNKSEIKILEDWFNRFYDFYWKTQQDSWIISNGLRKLMDNNIEFYCIATFSSNEFEIFGNRIINYDSKMNPWIYYDKNSNVKYRFHTSLEDQEKLSEYWFEHIKKNYYND